jgi:alpha-beta hydrolase superfamily lysophospholipase
MGIRNKNSRRIIWILLAICIIANIIAGFHAYKFTHFSVAGKSKTKDARHLSAGKKISAILFGISNPRPENKTLPQRHFTEFSIKSNRDISCWLITTDSVKKGTVILCHGYSGNKSGMLDKADIFLDAGYNTLLMDFMGSGGSEGHQTTIGFLEAVQVKSAYDHLVQTGETHIILFGTSMGAAAIMKAQQDYQFDQASLILECPFGTMLKTVQSRFRTMHIPSFPMDRLLVLWGGMLNGFNAFSHNPQDYALKIKQPVLLLHGEKDEKVSMEEIQLIFKNLQGKKTLKTYPLAGHENYLNRYRNEWTKDILEFIN